MTEPSDVRHHDAGRDGAGGSRPVLSLWHRSLRLLIVGAFIARAAFSVLEVQSVTTDSVRTLPFVAVSFGSDSAAWPLMWGTLSLVAALTLIAGLRMGWLIAFAVVAAYLVAGIADLTSLSEAGTGDPWQFAATMASGLAVPFLVLAGLLSLREAYLPPTRRPIVDGDRKA